MNNLEALIAEIKRRGADSATICGYKFLRSGACDAPCPTCGYSKAAYYREAAEVAAILDALMPLAPGTPVIFSVTRSWAKVQKKYRRSD